MKMIFKDLYIFSPSEKLGKYVSFEEGVNIISSNQVDGANVGKSVIMRSLYYALGAEVFFESKFAPKNKVFILKFAVDDYEYYIYRAASLFKLFDSNKKLISVATKSSELSKILEKITDFAVLLPDRVKGKLEITPPAFNYLLYYIDQDHHKGSKFESFDKLSQYQNFKENVLFYHFGVFDKDYFEIVREKEACEAAISECNKRHAVLDAMLQDIDSKLEVGGYSADLSALQKDVTRYKREYTDVVNRLNNSKNKLINFRNNLFDFQELLRETAAFKRKNDSAIKSIKKHTCPECGSVIDNTIELKSKKYNIAEDTIVVQNDLQISIHDLEEQIDKEEKIYQALLSELEQYESKLQINTGKINDILRYKGFCEIRDNVVGEISELDHNLSWESDRKKGISKRLKEYAAKKKKVETKYNVLMMNSKTKFGLDEIDPAKFENFKGTFSGSGSDTDIVTIIWYLTLIKLRNEFNPDAIKYPVVIDSPFNTEMDTEKEELLKAYLLENCEISGQFIMSGIGLDESIPESVGAKRIIIENERYHLLQKEDYNMYKELLETFCEME
ncbi:hypothetical protein [Agathobacter rectalis]|uniref:DUF2326 domain-containing protein n=1 Tax=Agathobacter rectalis TaxID=39491 RepID=A0A3E5APE0_9FIRM|nr:hypothetical protein [Agathobacter rectalis]RGN18901.1 hypothetical protein DXB76_06670 [Agathobacter rectalis]RGN23989.1 hypothetical protein DXB69_07080 [Agathobacter rectalis]RGN24289.1 hypothetical protein DXB72_06185 [Agathobacter rectalis]